MAKFVGMWEGNKDGYKQESESILIDQLILLAREFKLDFHQYVPIIQQPHTHVGRRRYMLNNLHSQQTFTEFEQPSIRVTM